MYSLYLKYFKYRDEFKEKQQQPQIPIDNSRIPFREETPLFQGVFITICSGCVAVLGSFAYNLRRFNQGGWSTTAILEPMSKPFAKQVSSIVFLSFATGCAYVSYHKYHENAETKRGYR